VWGLSQLKEREMAMNPQVKQKWVAALRSGEYKQATHYLNSPQGFCCLGVLCDLHAKETCTDWEEKGKVGLRYLGSEMTIPGTVQEWARLSSNHGESVSINRCSTLLTTHNDEGRTFAEMADAIEAQL
jgi:hypothetical protein